MFVHRKCMFVQHAGMHVARRTQVGKIMSNSTYRGQIKVKQTHVHVTTFMTPYLYIRTFVFHGFYVKSNLTIRVTKKED